MTLEPMLSAVTHLLTPVVRFIDSELYGWLLTLAAVLLATGLLFVAYRIRTLVLDETDTAVIAYAGVTLAALGLMLNATGTDSTTVARVAVTMLLTTFGFITARKIVSWYRIQAVLKRDGM